MSAKSADLESKLDTLIEATEGKPSNILSGLNNITFILVGAVVLLGMLTYDMRNTIDENQKTIENLRIEIIETHAEPRFTHNDFDLRIGSLRKEVIEIGSQIEELKIWSRAFIEENAEFKRQLNMLSKSGDEVQNELIKLQKSVGKN